MRRSEWHPYWEPSGNGELIFSRAGRTILSESVRPTINDVEEEGGGSATAENQEEDVGVLERDLEAIIDAEGGIDQMLNISGSD